jgi:hypothetical protein
MNPPLHYRHPGTEDGERFWLANCSGVFRDIWRHPLRKRDLATDVTP